jgi:hypothetical protein
MLPKITSETKYMEEGHEFNLKYTPFKFSIEAFDDE